MCSPPPDLTLYWKSFTTPSMEGVHVYSARTSLCSPRPFQISLTRRQSRCQKHFFFKYTHVYTSKYCFLKENYFFNLKNSLKKNLQGPACVARYFFSDIPRSRCQKHYFLIKWYCSISDIPHEEAVKVSKTLILFQICVCVCVCVCVCIYVKKLFFKRRLFF
jgi:hypothetical protein